LSPSIVKIDVKSENDWVVSAFVLAWAMTAWIGEHQRPIFDIAVAIERLRVLGRGTIVSALKNRPIAVFLRYAQDKLLSER
jgi:hypothetical protein